MPMDSSGSMLQARDHRLPTDASECGPPLSRHSVNAFLVEAEIISPTECEDYSPAKLLHERMRRKLIYHLMNPIEKWRTKGRFPWKLCLQVVKIIFITWQLALFGMHSRRYMQQHQDMTMSLRHIFMTDWTADMNVYPPTTGPYAVYTIPEFYRSLDYIVKQYSNISTMAIGSYSYDSPDGLIMPLHLCIEGYVGGFVFPFNSTVSVINVIRKNCIVIPAMYPHGDRKWEEFSAEKFLRDSNFTVNFATLVSFEINFALKTVFLKSLSKLDIPECYKLNVNVSYDNSEHDGQVPVSLLVESKKLNCNINTKYVDDKENRNYALRQLLNSTVIALCILSAIMCSRSLLSGQRLRREAAKFFKMHFRKVIPFTEHLDFVDFWYVMIVVSDILIVCGSVIKIQIEERHGGGILYQECSILLGVGNLLVWAGLLRYLGFFAKYNMLILTLKRAMPNVLRFVLCVIILYAGFCFCGWIVLSPYHIKFQTLSVTSECLFAVMNGDDMFATFALLNTDDDLIWYFSRFYLYGFLLLFVYVVISLFISVIMDTFETIKRMYVHGSTPKTTIQLFIAYKPLAPSPDITGQDERASFPVLKTFFAKFMYSSQCLWNHLRRS